MRKNFTVLFVPLLLVCMAARRKCDSDIFIKIRIKFERSFGKDRILKEFENYNCLAYRKGILKPLYGKKDTIFLINQYNSASGTIYAIIWDRYDTVSYINKSINGFNPEMTKMKSYNNIALSVISKWKEDTFSFYKSQVGAFDAGLMYISRITYDTAGSCSIDCYEIPEMFEWAK